MTIPPDVAIVIDAELARLTREVTPPPGPFAYGIDLDCVTDITADLREVDPESPRAIVQACIRRLTCPRGGLPDDPDYGFDVRAFANHGVTQAEIRDLAGRVRMELRKDDRVVDAVVSVTTAIGQPLYLEVMISPADPDFGTFTFTANVDDTGVLIETLTTRTPA